MFELQAKFTGSFNQDCQVKSVPHSLLALVDMIHNGSSSTLSVSHKMVTLMIFFRHENQAYPPSLYDLGKLRQGNKADLLSFLENCTESVSSQPNAEFAILDGVVVVNFLKPVAAKTFEDYAVKVFLPHKKRQLQ